MVPACDNIAMTPTCSQQAQDREPTAREQLRRMDGSPKPDTYDKDSHLDLPVIGSLVSCKSSALDRAASKEVMEGADNSKCSSERKKIGKGQREIETHFTKLIRPDLKQVITIMRSCFMSLQPEGLFDVLTIDPKLNMHLALRLGLDQTGAVIHRSEHSEESSTIISGFSAPAAVNMTPETSALDHQAPRKMSGPISPQSGSEVRLQQSHLEQPSCRVHGVGRFSEIQEGTLEQKSVCLLNGIRHQYTCTKTNRVVYTVPSMNLLHSVLFRYVLFFMMSSSGLPKSAMSFLTMSIQFTRADLAGSILTTCPNHRSLDVLTWTSRAVSIPAPLLTSLFLILTNFVLWIVALRNSISDACSLDKSLLVKVITEDDSAKIGEVVQAFQMVVFHLDVCQSALYYVHCHYHYLGLNNLEVELKLDLSLTEPCFASSSFSPLVMDIISEGYLIDGDEQKDKYFLIMSTFSADDIPLGGSSSKEGEELQEFLMLEKQKAQFNAQAIARGLGRFTIHGQNQGALLVLDLCHQTGRLSISYHNLIHEFNDFCWEKCMEKPGSKLDSRTETCMNNCVDRFIDVSLLITNRFAQLLQKSAIICMECEWKTILESPSPFNTSDRVSSLNLFFIGNLVYCESDTFDHDATEEALRVNGQHVFPSRKLLDESWVRLESPLSQLSSSSPVASLVLIDNSQLTSDSQYLVNKLYLMLGHLRALSVQVATLHSIRVIQSHYLLYIHMKYALLAAGELKTQGNTSQCYGLNGPCMQGNTPQCYGLNDPLPAGQYPEYVRHLVRLYTDSATLHVLQLFVSRLDALVENHLGKAILSTPDRDSNPDLPDIGSLIYCESDALDQAATEAGHM
uniref:(California timema) hypothetical protein n=1 Tax=Timema californicum TaxID=61474 RepID=A0A7R9J820_TIMCA|nr:unnamed protein product [Timema californicum]